MTKQIRNIISRIFIDILKSILPNTNTFKRKYHFSRLMKKKQGAIEIPLNYV